MRWSSEGAHLLLQVRCAVLDQRLDSVFREWHPKFLIQAASTATGGVSPPTLLQSLREPPAFAFHPLRKRTYCTVTLTSSKYM
jgi:hypothetical protein